MKKLRGEKNAGLKILPIEKVGEQSDSSQHCLQRTDTSSVHTGINSSVQHTQERGEYIPSEASKQPKYNNIKRPLCLVTELFTVVV